MTGRGSGPDGPEGAGAGPGEGVGPGEGARGEVLIAPSVLSCDPLELGARVSEVETAGADWLHVDVMDGHFVPAITFGPWMVETLRRVTSLPLDVHLMVEEPEKWVEAFAAAGASYVSFHVEACRHPGRLLRHLRSLGVKAGVALNPATSPALLEYLLPDLDLVVVMGVDPGLAGQPFLPPTITKVGEVRRLVAGRGGPGALPGRPAVEIEVDGGVGPENASSLAAAGASVLVAGKNVFGQPDPGEALTRLRRSLKPGS